jgi:choline dehydrogenase-like flavoprotein
VPGLGGFCAPLLPPEAGGPDPHGLAERVEGFLGRLPTIGRSGLKAGYVALDAFALATKGHRLARLDVEGRAQVLRRVAGNPWTYDALEALKAVVLLVHGADRFAPELRARSNLLGPVRPDPDLDAMPAAEWPGRMRCDAVVVGTGAGGAMAARTLARAGLDVVLVEEGRRWSVEEFRSAPPLERLTGLYRDGGTTVAVGRPPVVLPIGRAVGGSTVVNSGTCYRTPDAVLRRWRDDAGLALADPDHFGPYLDEVEATLAVGPVPLDVMGANGHLALAGAEALGWRARPLLRNAPGCGGCCQCSIGCPRNAKFGVHLNALPQACAAGARILSEARVQRVLHEDGRATGVLARRQDGSTVEILASRVLIAAGATETPPLLRRSGLARHRELGRNLALHPSLPAAGRFEEPVNAWRGVLQSAAVEEFHERDGILVEATSTPPGMGTMVLPGIGQDLLGELAAADHLATLGAMIADAPSGRVLGRRRAFLRYDLAGEDGSRLVKAIGVMGRVLFAAGAVEVLTGVPAQPRVRSVVELDEALASADPRRLHLAAFHPTGTARAGSYPERFPVAGDGRLRGTDGVWVVDASALPTCPEVNPQVTIMALALALAEGVAAT